MGKTLSKAKDRNSLPSAEEAELFSDYSYLFPLILIYTSAAQIFCIFYKQRDFQNIVSYPRIEGYKTILLNN